MLTLLGSKDKLRNTAEVLSRANAPACRKARIFRRSRWRAGCYEGVSNFPNSKCRRRESLESSRGAFQRGKQVLNLDEIWTDYVPDKLWWVYRGGLWLCEKGIWRDRPACGNGETEFNFLLDYLVVFTRSWNLTKVLCIIPTLLHTLKKTAKLLCKLRSSGLRPYIIRELSCQASHLQMYL